MPGQYNVFRGSHYPVSGRATREKFSSWVFHNSAGRITFLTVLGLWLPIHFPTRIVAPDDARRSEVPLEERPRPVPGVDLLRCVDALECLGVHQAAEHVAAAAGVR